MCACVQESECVCECEHVGCPPEKNWACVFVLLLCVRKNKRVETKKYSEVRALKFLCVAIMQLSDQLVIVDIGKELPSQSLNETVS